MAEGFKTEGRFFSVMRGGGGANLGPDIQNVHIWNLEHERISAVKESPTPVQ